MQRLTNAPAYHRATQKQKGLTLIELVLALIVIAISTTTIAKLLVTSLNFAETNRSYAEELRAAESCYETILAVHQYDEWTTEANNQESIYGGCEPDPSKSTVAVTPPLLSSWVKSPTYSDLFTDGTTQNICVRETPKCEQLDIDGKPATKFSFPIQGDQNLELIVPIRES